MPRPFLHRSMLAFLALAAIAARGQSSQVTSPGQRAKFMEMVQSLEENPLGPTAKEQRSEAMIWLIQAPDISVKVCGSLVQPLLETKKNHAAEIFGQMTLASGVFVIQHPDKARNDAAMYTAGLEGTLRLYESILRTKPKERWPFLDEWIEKRTQGTLPAEVAHKASRCK